MGANMQRQAVPLLRTEAPLVGTGMECRAAIDAGDVIIADEGRRRHRGLRRPRHRRERRRHHDHLPHRQVPPLEPGHVLQPAGAGRRGRPRSRSARSSPTARRPTSGELALGKNLLVAFMSWEGHNYEDAIILSSASCRTTSSPRSTSRSTRSTPATPSSARRRSPGTSRTSPRRCWPTSTSAASSASAPRSRAGDILVGKVTPKGETELTPEERLLRAIFGEKAREVRDTSLKVPHGESGTVIGVKEFDREDGDELPAGVNQLVRVYIAAEAQDHRRRQARRPSRQQGRHLQDPARRGHAVPRGRHRRSTSCSTRSACPAG